MPRRHIIKSQDCLSSVAAKYGMLPATIWQAPENKELRARRKNPKTLLAGDQLIIPDPRLREESVAAGTRQRFRRKAVPEKFRVVLRDEHGEPRGHLPYTLVIDGEPHDGVTDGNGVVEIGIPPDARDGELRLGDDREEIHRFQLGLLDPIETVSGAQQRLANLAYDLGRCDGNLDPATAEAIRSFQADQGLEATGKYDEATQARLEDVYGS